MYSAYRLLTFMYMYCLYRFLNVCLPIIYLTENQIGLYSGTLAGSRNFNYRAMPLRQVGSESRDEFHYYRLLQRKCNRQLQNINGFITNLNAINDFLQHNNYYNYLLTLIRRKRY